MNVLMRNRSTIVWLLLVILTAMSIVYVRHQSRALFVQWQAAESEADRLEVDWGRLQLEQATWAEAGRIESQARVRLGLDDKPPADVLVIIK